MTTGTNAHPTRATDATGTQTRTATATRYARARRRVPWWRTMAVAVRRTALAVTGWLRDTVTTAGWLLVAAAVLGLALGLAFGIAEATVAGVVAAALLAISAPFLAGGRDLGIRLELERDRVVAGRDVSALVHLTNRARTVSLPGVVDIPVGEGLVEAHVPLLRPGAQHRESLAIAARRRGIIDVGPMTIARGDPVGILRRELRWNEVQSIYVHPVTTAVPSLSAGLVRDLEGAPTGVLADADLSFHAIREYATGDSQRHVHWKATAKTGRLMVRQYEETRRSRVAVVLDIDTADYSGEHDAEHGDDAFELAVSAAASLGVRGVRDGRDLLMTLSARPPEFARGTAQQVVTIPAATPRGVLDGMCILERAENAMRLESVARLAGRAFGDLSIVFLVTGGSTALGRLRRSAIAFSPDTAVVAVRCDPGAQPTVRRTGELTIMTLGALGDLRSMLARGVLG